MVCAGIAQCHPLELLSLAFPSRPLPSPPLPSPKKMDPRNCVVE
jgi:hypothetical protein